MTIKANGQEKDIEYLLEIEKRYQILVENANDAICFISPEGKYLFYNSKFLEMFGYTDAEMEDKTFYDIVHPDDFPLVKKRRKARLLGEAVHRNYEYRAVTKDGKTLYIGTNATLVKRGDEVLGIQTILRDVTERKKVEKKLRESEERYRNLVEFSPEMIAIHDEGKILYINPTGAKLLGAEGPEEVINRPILDFVHPDYRGVIATQLQQVQGEEKHKSFIEGTLIRTDGQVIHYEVHSTPVTYLNKHVRQIILRDITDRKMAEKALRIREKQLADSQKVARLGSWGWDIQKNKITWSDELYRIFGLKPQEFEATYEAFLGMVHPDDKGPLDNAVKESLREKKPYHIDARIIRPDGTEWVMEARGEVTYDESGNPGLMGGTAQDITERKKAEEALRESEEKYRGIFDESIAAVYVFDKKKNFIDSNPAGLDLLGYSRVELLNMNISDVDADPIVVLPAHEQLLSGERIINYEHKLKKKDGTIITVLNNSKPLTDVDGNVIGMQSTLIDITERKLAEEEIKHLKEFNENIVQSMTEGIMIEDENGIITFANPRTEELLGYSKGELIGKHCKEIASPEYLKKIEEETAKRPKGISSSYEAAILSKTEDKIPIIISAAPLFEDDAFKGVLTVFTDIRELKILEKQHIDARNEAEFYIDLMGHDINNDNTVAQGLLSLILEENSELSEKQSKLIVMALKAVRRSSNLIDSVRTLQIAKATGEEIFKKTDLSNVLDNAINEAKALHNDKEILINYKPKEAYIYTDNLVKDLFLNLLDNAAKYDLSDEVNIDIEVEDMGGSWRIGIKDHGSGIPDDLKEVIFARFQRIDKGMRGSGIGLHLVKTLIDKYNGNIYVESRVKGDHSKGSIFYVTLPKA